MTQHMINELQVVHDVLRVPHLSHADQNMALAGTFVVLLHLGNFAGHLLRIGLVDTHTIHPHELCFGRDHEPLDLVQLLSGYTDVPFHTTYSTIVPRCFLAPCIGYYVEVIDLARTRIKNTKISIYVAEKSQREVVCRGIMLGPDVIHHGCVD